jgi:enterochelin esterase-like enzyme/outer membrane protein assembly factor BamB
MPDAKLFDGDSGTLTLGWKRALGSGYSALAVSDGRVMAMFADGDADYLAAFDVATGDEIWRYRIADTYAGHDGSHDGPISTPLVNGGRVYGLGAHGDLFAVDARSGAKVWAINIVEAVEAKPPHYGFTTSPLMADGVLVVETGAEGGRAIAGFDPDTGKNLWAIGDDTFEYHSPIVASVGGRRQVVAAGRKNLYGIDARSGKELWSYAHEGDERAMGGFSIVPLPAGEGRLFLMNKIDASVMLSVTRIEDHYDVSEMWSSNGIKQSYVPPVYHDGHIYGMANRIFTCIDAETGEIKWRSREPGDGFPTLVGDKLVIITKPGSLHVAEASAAGYNELARLDLFEEHSWSEVAYVGGHLFARSMASLARIDVTGSAVATDSTDSWVTQTGFGRFLAEVEQATDKGASVDAFLAGQPSFPIIEETGVVHFVYRGEAQDVGIVGDMIGYRREDPMTRVDGTDLFYYSTLLEPNAAVTYGFIPDYGDPVADPLNSRAGEGLFGEVSWFAMPAWQAPDFLSEAAASRQGRMESVEWESTVGEEPKQRTAQVYLPAGYDAQAERRYPTLYVHNGQDALDSGSMKNALDQLIGNSIEPLIAVFVIADEENPRRDLGRMEPYSKMLVEELVPRIDEKYRTIDASVARATAGAGRGANVALYSAMNHPGVFGRAGAQSPTMSAEDIPETLGDAVEQPLVMYIDWGTYHLRSPHEAWDLARESRKLWAALRERGYRPAGGEVPEGYGWACWSGHTDELLTAMFPLRDRSGDPSLMTRSGVGN